VAQKKGLVRCEDQDLKAIWNRTEPTYKPVASQSQCEFQAAFVSRRFGLMPFRAQLVAELAFSNGRAR